jgi:predicted nucleotidyltransferase
MVLNKDFKEFIKLLNENDVKYLIVGGYAVGFHGYPRYTKDLDIWLLVSEVNAQKVLESLKMFGFGNVGLIKEDFLKTDEFVQLGYPPNRIDIVTSCDGVEFNKCFEEKIETVIDGVNMYFINLENLKKNKKATGRPQDLADLDNLGKNKI